MYEKNNQLKDKILSDENASISSEPKKEPNSKHTSTKTLNLLSNPQYDLSRPIRQLSSFQSQSFTLLERKIVRTTSMMVAPIEYLTTIFNYTIGYGTLWRFPYYFQLCHGGIFFIPFLIFYFLIGIPLLTMESALGQIFKANPDEMLTKIKKKLYGLGLVSNISSFVINVYLSVITSWCVYFFFVSFKAPLPWDIEFEGQPNHLLNKYFVSRRIINIDCDNNTNNITLGSINTTLLICLLITWVLLCLVTYLDIKINSKMLYVTSISPIVLLVIVLFELLKLPHGFSKEIWFFIWPSFGRLLDYKVWLYACNQAVFILMLGFGGNVIFSAKKNENEDVYKRSIYISFTQLIMGVVCTLINCIVCGYMANELNIDDISNLPFNKASHPFIVYPFALGMMKYSNLWSLLFFAMMIVISIQSQMIFIEGLSVSISQYSNSILSIKGGNIIICIFGFLFGIPFITQGGFFLLEWVDRYSTMIPLFLVILMETLIIVRTIGVRAIREIIANKTGMVLPGYVLASIGMLCPITMGILMVICFIYHICDLPNNVIFFILQWVCMVYPFVLVFYFFIKKQNEDNRRKDNEVRNIIANSTEMQKLS